MKRSLTLLLLVLLPIWVFAQESYKISPKSTVKVDGTSTMHDWSMQSSSVQGTVVLDQQGGKINNIKQANLKLAAESLKSGKDAMDKNAYKALNTGKHKDISFVLTGIKSVEQQNGATKIIALGTVTIAGKSKAETIELIGRADSKGAISFQGSKAIKMSEYGVEPPSFMFGSVTTGDAITINFNIQLSSSQDLVNN
ncbi:YceI family protein [Cesiribacter sp. SM1]|uniref:YceI family protein n=1 Tax=Cesiribacter sp. SM1 TaxID=2861196 RepID=UPI001CD7BDBA|nr:YceI family protein [Cesiribacter sp. SM1]